MRVGDAASMPNSAIMPCGHRSVAHTVRPRLSAAACPVPVGTMASESVTLSVNLKHRFMSSYTCDSIMFSLASVCLVTGS